MFSFIKKAANFVKKGVKAGVGVVAGALGLDSGKEQKIKIEVAGSKGGVSYQSGQQPGAWVKGTGYDIKAGREAEMQRYLFLGVAAFLGYILLKK